MLFIEIIKRRGFEVKIERELDINNLVESFDQLRDSVPEGETFSLYIIQSEEKKICVDLQERELRAFGDPKELVAWFIVVEPGNRNVDIFVEAEPDNSCYFFYDYKKAIWFDAVQSTQKKGKGYVH